MRGCCFSILLNFELIISWFKGIVYCFIRQIKINLFLSVIDVSLVFFHSPQHIEKVYTFLCFMFYSSFVLFIIILVKANVIRPILGWNRLATPPPFFTFLHKNCAFFQFEVRRYPPPCSGSLRTHAPRPQSQLIPNTWRSPRCTARRLCRPPASSAWPCTRTSSRSQSAPPSWRTAWSRPTSAPSHWACRTRRESWQWLH